MQLDGNARPMLIMAGGMVKVLTHFYAPAWCLEVTVLLAAVELGLGYIEMLYAKRER